MRAIFYFFSACFALLTLIGRVQGHSNLGPYWPSIPNRLATPFVDHLLVAVSVIAASLLFGAAITRRSPIERLSQLRKIGVPLRNSPVTNPTEFELWTERFWSWRKEIIDTAKNASKRLADRLEVLNEMSGFPAGIIPFNSEHARLLGIMSEILRRSKSISRRTNDQDAECTA
jgi:hypothetical protein